MTGESNSNIPLADKFAGCLLGLALGDCLGASWEGYLGTEVAEAYYDGRFDPVNLRMSEWTDDTAMAMATAQSIVDTGRVDGADLAIMLGNWGTAGTGDINGDGVVNGADLGILLGAWG